MRDIKFRCWDVLESKFVQDDNFIYKELADQAMFNPEKSQYYILQQYTGLKDKNGKEIYEGDIILIHGQESREVVFKHAFWMIENLVESRVLGGFGTPTDSGHKPIYRYGEDGMEVIGNIYENPSVIQCQQSTPA